MMQRVCEVELQRRADNAGTIFLVVADFWERPKNRAMMSLGLFCLFCTLNLAQQLSSNSDYVEYLYSECK